MDEKRTLDEILALYTLEPALKDIYVEGRSDKCFVDWYLYAKGVKDASVYTIDFIDIPNDVLLNLGLPPHSHRSRVLALACELSKNFPTGLKVLCLADRDFEDYCPSVSESAYLLLTDCNALELYAFSEKTMHKFTTVALGGLPLHTNKLIEALILVLQRVYTYRLSNELLDWRMEWVPFSNYVKIEKGLIEFNESGFRRAYLQKNGRWHERSVFEVKLEDVTRSLSHNITHKIRGHDLSELLLIIIRKMRRDRKFGNLETLEGCLLAAVETQDLDVAPFFQRILQTTLSS